MTYKDIINSVLRRLREDEIDVSWEGDLNNSNEATSYQKLVGELVNDAKKYAEARHDWNILKKTSTHPLVAGVSTYNVADIRQGLRLLSVHRRKTGDILQQIEEPFSYLGSTDSHPTKYSVTYTEGAVPFSSSPTLGLLLHPEPTGSYSVSDYLTSTYIQPQDDLKGANDSLSIPSDVVVLGAWARAISERGEDGGSVSNAVGMESEEALRQAIQLDFGNNTESERDWYVG